MIARVVAKRDEARLALAASVTAAVGLALVVVDDFVRTHLFSPPSPGVYLFVALLIALGGFGPWLAWTRRGRATQVQCGNGSVAAGATRIEAKDVTALSLAEGARGSSVAIARSKQLTFLEVERREDAERIAKALEVPRVPFGAIDWPRASRALAIVQAIVSVAAVVAAPLYYLAALHLYTPVPSLGEGKALFGIGGVVAVELAMILLVVRRLLPGHAVALASGAWDAHVALHRASAADAAATASAAGAGDGASARDAVEDARAGGSNLGRGDEPIGAWLARIDAIPAESHAYRGDAMNKEVLWETLGDSGAPVDARMAAARVLHKRYQEDDGALVRVVEDPEVRVRVEAALEESDEWAEHRIETLGPLFRAR